jgi:hypothetical protein
MTKVVNTTSEEANKAVFRFLKITESSSIHLYWINSIVSASSLQLSLT